MKNFISVQKPTNGAGIAKRVFSVMILAAAALLLPQNAFAYIGQQIYTSEGVRSSSSTNYVCTYTVVEENTVSNEYAVELAKAPENISGRLVIALTFYVDNKKYKIKRVGDYAFDNCEYVTHVFFGSYVETIGAYAFRNCTKLKQIMLNKVATIGTGAFSGCTGLEGVSLPNSLTTVRSNIFKGCTGLKYISSEIKNPDGVDIADNALSTNANGTVFPKTLYVKEGKVDDFKKSSAFKNFSTIKEGVEYRFGFRATQYGDFNGCYMGCYINNMGGNIWYDPETNTLTLDHLTMKDFSVHSRSVNKDRTLNVKVKGSNYLSLNWNNNENAEAVFGADVNSTLNIEGEEGASISLTVYENNGAFKLGYNSSDKPAYLNIKNVNINIFGEGKYGFTGTGGSEVLRIYNSRISAQCAGEVMTNLTYIWTEGIDVATPVRGAWFRYDSSNRMALVDSTGAKVTGKALIVPAYDLYICGTKVNTENRSQLAFIDGVDADRVTYDPEKNILTLENATLFNSNANFNNQNLPENRGTWALCGSIPGLVIKIKGKCKIVNEVDKYAPLCTSAYFSKGVKIIGVGDDASLEVECAEAIAINASDSLTLDNIKLTAKGNNYGIKGEIGQGDPLTTLVINNSVVRSSGNLSMGFFKEVKLENCEIITPKGAEFKDRYNYLMLGGENVTDVLIASPNSPVVGIGKVESGTGETKPQVIYTPDGLRLNQPVEQLPRGIYIIDGKKIIKK